MTLIEKIKAWRNAENPAPITLKNIWAVIQSYYRQNDPGVPKHIAEQVVYRKTVSNKECVSSNVCKCGCEWSDLIWSDKSCDGKCYPVMMDEINWNYYKEINNIKLNATPN